MDGVSRESTWHLGWAGVIAGAAIAIACTWTGDLFNGMLSMLTPGESSGWAWIGSLLGLAALVAGAGIGGYVASRVGGAQSRSEGMLHGLVVWGILGFVSSMLFAILGGNVPLVVGTTPGAMRLALGFGMLGLLGGLATSLIGGAFGATREAVEFRRLAAAGRRERRKTPHQPRAWPGEEERTTTTWSSDNPPKGPGGGVPPSVH